MPNLRINFSHNWNNKLHCNIFTTLRLRNDKKYIIGNKYDAYLKQELVKRVNIVAIKHFKLKDINEFIAGVDTGYSAFTCKDILTKMYSKRVKDINTQPFSFILLSTIK